MNNCNCIEEWDVCTFVPDSDEWEADFDFDEFFEELMTTTSWSTHICMHFAFGDGKDDINMVDFILERANNEQCTRYIERMKKKLYKLDAKLSDISKSARNI